MVLFNFDVETTTPCWGKHSSSRLFLFQFYIKPQQDLSDGSKSLCCFLFQFYIKPQHIDLIRRIHESCFLFQSTSNHNRFLTISSLSAVVSYFNSTSNHNRQSTSEIVFRLFLISILHQTTTGRAVPVESMLLFLISILYQTTTSGHGDMFEMVLFLISILYQTTTRRRRRGRRSRLFRYPKITAPGNQLYTKLCNKYVANFTSLMRKENQQIQLMLILCYPVI